VDLKQVLKSAEEAAEKPKYVLRAVDAIEEDVRAALLRMLERGGKSSGQLHKQLVEKEFPLEVIDLIMARFTEVGLIDDFALAKDHARVLFERKSKAKAMIAMDLREKGFPKDAITEALASIEVDDELELAKELALSKMSRMTGQDKATAERKVAGYLARKGYPSSVVWSAVRYASEQQSL